MARVRKEKGGSSQSTSSAKLALSKSSKKKTTDALLHEQVLALGGTQDDIDLMKDVDKTAVAGPSKHDVCFQLDPFEVIELA